MPSISNRNATAALVCALVVLFLTLGLSMLHPKSHDDTERWVDAHLQLIRELQAIQDSFRDAELKHQSYIITGSSQHLNEFGEAAASVKQHLEAIKTIQADDLRYNERFRDLGVRIYSAIDQFKASAQYRAKSGEESARSVLLTSRELKDAQDIIASLAKAQFDEQQLLRDKLKQLSLLSTGAAYWILGGVSMILIGIVWFVAGHPPKITPLVPDFPTDLQEKKIRQLQTELNGAKEQLERLANVDFLTEVLNMRGLQQVLTIEENRLGRAGGQLVALLINLDNFRRINEGLGHATGDVILKEVANRIVATLRPSDHVARAGGDEFLVLLPDTQLAYAMRVAERIRMAVSDSPLRNASEVVTVTVSIGVANLPNKTVSAEEVVALARSALKRGKQSGKNKVSLAREGISEEDSPTSKSTLELLTDPNQFRVVYQPILDLNSDLVAGYEILSRGPDGAYESPADFFRICVENNILTTVDLQCLKLCLDGSSDVAPNMRIHINLFPSTILDTPIENLLALFPQKSNHHVFCLEISEQQFIGDPSYLRDHVNALKQHGILVAIDDVGFGRSSLETLILLEPDVVKVDRKYVSGLSNEPAKSRLLRRLANVAKSLGAEIVAEGIETNEDLPILKEIGIKYGQGWLWGGLLEVLPAPANQPRSAYSVERK